MGRKRKTKRQVSDSRRQVALARWARQKAGEVKAKPSADDSRLDPNHDFGA